MSQKAFENLEDAILGLISVVEPILLLLIDRNLTSETQVDKSLAERYQWFLEHNQPDSAVVVEGIRKRLHDPDRIQRRFLSKAPPEGTA